MTVGDAIIGLLFFYMGILPLHLMYRRDDPLTFHLFLAYPASIALSVAAFFTVDAIMDSSESRSADVAGMIAALLIVLCSWLVALGFAIYRKFHS
jgi:hypothetical protein